MTTTSADTGSSRSFLPVDEARAVVTGWLQARWHVKHPRVRRAK